MGTGGFCYYFLSVCKKIRYAVTIMKAYNIKIIVIAYLVCCCSLYAIKNVQ